MDDLPFVRRSLKSFLMSSILVFFTTVPFALNVGHFFMYNTLTMNIFFMTKG